MLTDRALAAAIQSLNTHLAGWIESLDGNSGEGDMQGVRCEDAERALAWLEALQGKRAKRNAPPRVRRMSEASRILAEQANVCPECMHDASVPHAVGCSHGAWPIER